MQGAAIIKAVESVTKKWTKLRKAEERGRSQNTRKAVFIRQYAMSIKDAAWSVMEAAYNKASDNGRLPAQARQLYYAARPSILELTGRGQLSSQYFTQTIVPMYMAEKGMGWDVVYDARGHFAEPHTEKIIDLGTLGVREFLSDVNKHDPNSVSPWEFETEGEYPTCGPEHRFSAILFIEKEGFLPLFEAVKLAERYDIAVMSTKGMPVVACRHLADELCGSHDIPLLVLHDFDKAGFSIVATLADVDHYDRDFNERVKRYEYRNSFSVIDLGLRLADVQKYNLESEVVRYAKSDPCGNLAANGATPKEIEFLYGNGWNGRRVELNAFTSEDFIEWIEGKLKQHKIGKVVPDADTLEAAYRRAAKGAYVRDRIEEIEDAAEEHGADIDIPKNLERLVRQRLKKSPELPWDKVIASIVEVDEV